MLRIERARLSHPEKSNDVIALAAAVQWVSESLNGAHHLTEATFVSQKISLRITRKIRVQKLRPVLFCGARVCPCVVQPAPVSQSGSSWTTSVRANPSVTAARLSNALLNFLSVWPIPPDASTRARAFAFSAIWMSRNLRVHAYVIRRSLKLGHFYFSKKLQSREKCQQ